MKFFTMLDTNKDGEVSVKEFCDGVNLLNIHNLSTRQIQDAFAHIDQNKSGSLSLGEIWLYVEGAKPTVEERKKFFERELQDQLQEQVDEIFSQFDTQGKGEISIEKMEQILATYSVKPENLKKLSKEIDKNNDKKISKREFETFMLDFCQKLLFEEEEELEELKNLFLEADVDNNGFLSIDEIYSLLTLRLGVEIRIEELEELIGEADRDQDLQIDIEEFIDLMSKRIGGVGTDTNKQTIARIR